MDHSYFQITGQPAWSPKANPNLTCGGIQPPSGPVDFGALASSNRQLSILGMYQAFKSGGTQDFKNRMNYPDPAYGDTYNRAAIGNFNFGASLNERGWELTAVQFWAGTAAELSNTETQLGAAFQQIGTAEYNADIAITGQPPIPMPSTPASTTGPGFPGFPVMAPNGIMTQGDQAAPNENQAVVQGWLWSTLGCDK